MAGRKAAARGKPKPMRLARVGNDAVERATGRAWDEWLKLLDRAGARRMPHKEIAQLLNRQFKIPGWWCQMVTVGYEQARGLRAVNQNARGFSAHISKTVAAPVSRLYDAWSDAQQRARWLPVDAPVEIHRASRGKSMRITWTRDRSSVDVGFVAKGAGKSQVALEHGKLKSAAAVARQKEFWKSALARLKLLVEA
jgi:uncharacterized protein YndB with AHSA1/START domain